ncbi:methyltransferase N6AMT1 [Anthonomus grandis grandis]|uniref:methyltransferase N6AMT1 n=1 Tax=Anthonomus grandis grandis TaxID=2921223 RepID=UPI002165394F|nr:methyltransferase N6AMT1 [Anthonomus grandis grandis]
MPLPTPHYNLSNHQDVYEPSEDTFLFLDALEKETEFINKKQPLFACEVGSGSGILITGLANLLANPCMCFSTDINISACQATQYTAQLNNKTVEVIATNLFDGLTCDFDIILFNPPYVITNENEVVGRGINRAYAGGELGRQITDRFIEKLPKVLSKNGVCYLLLLKENNVTEIEKMLTKLGFKSEIVLERKIPGEYLYVYKIYR